MEQHHRAGSRLGMIALVVTLGVAALLPDAARLDLFALLLALTAGIYLGFGWIDGRRPWVAIEGVVGLAFLGLALLGAAIAPWFVAFGFLLHVVWDVAHHPKAVGTRIARWVPPACLLYDVGVAVAILYWWPPF